MTELTANYSNCGLHELTGLLELRDYPALADFLCKHETGMILFHDNVSWGNGTRLAKWITDNGLGPLTKSTECENPIHPDGLIAAWIWDPDYAKLRSVAKPGRHPFKYYNRAEVQNSRYWMQQRQIERDAEMKARLDKQKAT